ncbi:MAG: carbonic anhydrase [bacterium]
MKMKIAKSLIIAWALPLIIFGTAAAKEAASGVNGNQALEALMAGNKRYTAVKNTYPNQTAERRAELVKGQKPFAIILSCSDSRVPPEIIFDQGLGDLFVIRVAGNVVDDIALGSIEYAAEHLGTPLIMVLGHEKCGAVTATVEGGEAPGHIGSFTKAIKPAVEKAKDQPGDKVDNTVKANVELIVEQLKVSKPILSELVKEGRLKIVGARYDLDTGAVDITHE